MIECFYAGKYKLEKSVFVSWVGAKCK